MLPSLFGWGGRRQLKRSTGMLTLSFPCPELSRTYPVNSGYFSHQPFGARFFLPSFV
jgi:hypothetical protein